jgi:flagellar protein FliO/FliZ
MGLLWFVVVLAVIPTALWLLKRSGMTGLRAPGQGGLARLVGSLSLGTQQRVVTVEVGEGASRRWLVLGVTAQSITTLHTLEEPPVVAVAEAAVLPFAQALRAQVQTRLEATRGPKGPQA